ncbi:MAG TPA: hypothetical protein PKV72_05985, partial [Candidatus Peribacteria bacterium]|nr:hypothetical protein [Candidatus Peribacteria bacterium]
AAVPGKETADPAEVIGQTQAAGRSRMKLLMWAGAGLVAATLVVGAGIEGIRQYRQSAAEKRVAARKLNEERREQEEIAYLRRELTRDREIAHQTQQALAVGRPKERDRLISALAAMEQWLASVEKVRAYEKSHVTQPSSLDVIERMEEEKVVDAVRTCAAELRASLEKEGPVIIGGRRYFYR